jgi:hypothetical protein
VGLASPALVFLRLFFSLRLLVRIGSSFTLLLLFLLLFVSSFSTVSLTYQLLMTSLCLFILFLSLLLLKGLSGIVDNVLF